MLAAVGHVAMLDHAVEIGAQSCNAASRRLSSRGISSAITLVTTTRGLMQNHVAERDAVG